MALAWKAGWVNSPQGFESPILRHADQRKRRDGLTESDPAFGLWSRFPSQSGLIGIVVDLWLSPDQAALAWRHHAESVRSQRRLPVMVVRAGIEKRRGGRRA